MPADVSKPADAYVTLARILRSRGNRGEVAAELLTDFPERLTKLREVFLWDGRSAPRKAAVQTCWLHQKRAIFHFEGCDLIDAAEKLRGLEVQVPLAERVVLPEGQYFVTDLIGCEAFEGGTRLGVVKDVQFTGAGVAGTPLLSVERLGGELLIPLAEDICTRIDTVARRIEVVLPDGLKELSHEA